MSHRADSTAAPARTRLVHVTTVPVSLRFLAGQVGHMRARGIDVTAVSSPGEELRAFGERERVPVHAVEMPRRISPLRDLVAVVELVRLFREIRPDIVHAHTPKGGLLGTLAAWLAGVPLRIYHVRGLPFLGAEGRRATLLRFTERVSCRLAHRVLSVSHSVRDVLVSDKLCAPNKVAVLARGSGQGVDAARFDPDACGAARLDTRERLGIPKDAPVIGFIGRVVRDKGITELADAWSRLRKTHPSLHLMLLGAIEPQDPAPTDALTRLRDDPNVHWIGHDWDTVPLYAAMDVVVLPTYREGFPNVLLEAAAMRLAVVATRVPGCVDAVVDGSTGTLVAARDARALASAVAVYLDDPSLRARHGDAGRARVVRDFPREALWDAMHKEYEQLLARRGLTSTATRPARSLGVHTAQGDA